MIQVVFKLHEFAIPFLNKFGSLVWLAAIVT